MPTNDESAPSTLIELKWNTNHSETRAAFHPLPSKQMQKKISSTLFIYTATLGGRDTHWYDILPWKYWQHCHPVNTPPTQETFSASVGSPGTPWTEAGHPGPPGRSAAGTAAGGSAAGREPAPTQSPSTGVRPVRGWHRNTRSATSLPVLVRNSCSHLVLFLLFMSPLFFFV